MAFICGNFRSAPMVALMMNGRNDSFSPRLAAPGVHPGPQGDQLGAVNLLDVGDMRRRLLRPHQLLGDLPAQPPEGNPHTVRLGMKRRS